MSSDRHIQKIKMKFGEQNSSTAMFCSASSRYIYLSFLSTHAFERKSEKNKTAWPGDLTTENVIYNENMKNVKEKIEAQLEKNMSKIVIVLDHMQCVFHLSRFRCSQFL